MVYSDVSTGTPKHIYYYFACSTIKVPNEKYLIHMTLNFIRVLFRLLEHKVPTNIL